MSREKQIDPRDLERMSVFEFKEFLTEFAEETDRAAVVLGAARLDLLLNQMLTYVLLPSPTGQDELLDGDKPLSTFSAKINLAYRMGLIDMQLARTLHLIRKIRNSFAHETSTKSFATGAHRDRVRELMQPFFNIDAYNSIRKIFSEKMTAADEVAIDFRTVLAIAVLRLQDPEKKCDRIANDQSITLILSEYVKRA